jgi:transposase
MQLEVERLDHLPVIAGIIDEIGLIEKIDVRIPPHADEKVTTGEAVAALILCGMGFLQKPLSLTPHFFAERPIGYLLGNEELQASDFNHWKLGRELEHLFDFGVGHLFAEISLEVCQEQGIDRSLCHGDTTSFSFCGSYEDQAEEAVQITYGYSKDHRPDLKQIVWEMAVSEDWGIPLLCAAWSGNASDSEIFHQRLRKLKTAFLAGHWPNLISIHDSKGYSKRNQVWFDHLHFVSRVPATYADHDKCVKQAISQGNWIAVDDSEQKFWQEFNRDGERWLVVYSLAGEDRSRNNLSKAITKEKVALSQKLARLKRKCFGCEADARQAATELFSKAKYHRYSQLQVEAITKHVGRGRPKADSEKILDHWRVIGAQIEEDVLKLVSLDRERACYIVATNVPLERMSGRDVVEAYGKQSTVERGFRFLKDPLFFTSALFLKKPERVQGLLMVMTLAMMVYALAERRLRQILAATGETLPNQIKLPTRTPTLRWVFQMLDGIHRVHLTLPGQPKQCLIEGLDDRKVKALRLFGSTICRYYQIPLLEPCSM